MRRAYRPHLATVQLLADILALPDVDSARIIAPHHGTTRRPARILVTLAPQGSNPERARTTFSLPAARAWYASERAMLRPCYWHADALNADPSAHR